MELTKDDVKIDNKKVCFLKGDYNNGALQFSYSLDEKTWKKIGSSLDATVLSDECCKEGCFTGSFAGLCCQELSGQPKHADFDFFEYKEL
jgi:xylan 1,4-beta-xylosidase